MTPRPGLMSLACIGLIVCGLTISGRGVGASAPAPQAAPTSSLGIGAIGRIEPRSRVLKLSHDQGPEGARIDQVLVQEGQTVEPGTALVIFSDRDRRQAELAMAQARVKTAQARLASYQSEKADADTDFKRYKSLVGSATVSRAAYDRALDRANKATADLEAARFEIETAIAETALAELKTKQSILTAPFTGTVLKIHAWQGERVGDQQIMEFADLGQLDVVAEVYENDLPRISPGQKAEVRLPGIDRIYQASVREKGFLVRKNDLNDTDPLADTDNRVVEVRLTIDQPGITDLMHQIYRQVQVQIKP